MSPTRPTRGVSRQQKNEDDAGRGMTRSTRAAQLGESKPVVQKPGSPVKRKAPTTRKQQAALAAAREPLSKNLVLPATTLGDSLKTGRRAAPIPLADDRPAAVPDSQRSKLRSAGVTSAAALNSTVLRTRPTTRPEVTSRPEPARTARVTKKLEEPGTPTPKTTTSSRTRASTIRRDKRRRSDLETSKDDSTSHPPTLFSLPLEIHVNILLYVDVVDLLAFRRTCRQAGTLSRDRQLWLYAYRILALRIPPPRSVTPPSALTSQALEQLTCHMLKLDRNWRSANPLPVRKRRLRHFTRNTEVMVENMYLIPGGRWLLVLTMDSVTLWDLDPDMLGEPTATVQEFDESYERSYMIVDATDAPTSANLLIVSMDGARSHVTVWHLPLQANLPDIKQLHHFIAPFALQVSNIDQCIALRSDELALVCWTADLNHTVVINWKKSKAKMRIACSFSARDNMTPEVVQLLPNDRILLLSEARLTIHDVPELFSVKTLDTLNSSEAEALWLLDISYGPTIDPTSNLWVFEGLPKQLLLADVTCIICIMAPTFRYIIRVPSASTLPLETSQASFAKPTLASATDVGIYRGVVKQYTTGLFCFVGNIDEWIGVDEGVTRLRYYNVSDLSTENGSEPASATLVTFDEGSGKVCVLNRFTNNIEALDFV